MFLSLLLACTGPVADDSSTVSAGDGLTWVTFDYDCAISEAGDFTYPTATPVVFQNLAMWSANGTDLSYWEPIAQAHLRPGAAWDPAGAADSPCESTLSVTPLGGRITIAYRADE
jgi:hypothetical protein